MVVAKIWFFSRKTTYMFWTQLVFAQSELDRRNCGICSKLTVKTLERSQLTPLRYLLALIRLRSSHLSCSIEKNCAIFTGKDLCWSLFSIKLQEYSQYSQVFSCEYCKVFKYLFRKTFANGCFSRLQTFLQSYRKPNWNVVWIKLNIYCLI